MTRNPYNAMSVDKSDSAPADPRPEVERLLRDIVAWWAQGKVAISTDPAAVAIREYIRDLDSRS